MSRTWDAATYHRVSGPQREMATAVLDRLELRGDETVLDAGCGSGAVTRLLLERLPDGEVIAVDADPDMVGHARAALPATVTVLRQDLQELALDRRVDAAFSNAVFHWVPDHERLFAALAAALRSGGRLSAQCGGEGNIARVHAAARAELGAEPPRLWNFAGPEESEARLRAAGFRDARAWLQPWPVTPEEPAAYLKTVCCGPFLELLPPDEHDGFVARVLRRVGPELDYVRLNLVATR